MCALGSRLHSVPVCSSWLEELACLLPFLVAGIPVEAPQTASLKAVGPRSQVNLKLLWVLTEHAGAIRPELLPANLRGLYGVGTHLCHLSIVKTHTLQLLAPLEDRRFRREETAFESMLYSKASSLWQCFLTNLTWVRGHSYGSSHDRRLWVQSSLLTIQINLWKDYI